MTIASDYTITRADDGKILYIDASGGDINIYLPYALEVGSFVLKKIDTSSNAISLIRKSNDTIEQSENNFEINGDFDSIEVHSDRNSNWWVIGGANQPSSFKFSTATKTVKPIEIYIDGNNGLDTNPGSSTFPLKTFSAAYNKIPDIVDHEVFIYVLSKGSVYEVPTLEDRLLRSNIHIVGASSKDSLETIDLITDLTASGGSKNSVTTPSIGGVNTYRGKSVEVVSGSSQGDIRTIFSHTDTEIVPTIAFSNAITSGSVLKIFEPKVEIKFPDIVLKQSKIGSANQDGFLPRSVQSGVSFINFKFDTNVRCSFNGTVYLYGMELTGSAPLIYLSTTFNGGYAYVAGDSEPGQDMVSIIGSSSFGRPTTGSWQGWGIGCPNNFLILNDFRGTIGSIVADRFPVQDSVVYVSGFNFYNGGVRAFRPLVNSTVVNFNHLFVGVAGEKDGNISGTLGWGVLAERKSKVSIANAIIDGGSSPAVHAKDGANVYLSQCVLSGSHGVLAQRGAVVLTNQSSYFEVSSTISDFQVEDTVTSSVSETVSNFSQTGSYISLPDGSKIQRIS